MLGLAAAWAVLPAPPAVRAPGGGDLRPTVSAVGWLLLLSIAIFAGADELHQFWIRGRNPSGADWLADLCGALVGPNDRRAMGTGRLVVRFRRIPGG